MPPMRGAVRREGVPVETRGKREHKASSGFFLFLSEIRKMRNVALSPPFPHLDRISLKLMFSFSAQSLSHLSIQRGRRSPSSSFDFPPHLTPLIPAMRAIPPLLSLHLPN